MTYTNPWTYQGKVFDDGDIGDAVGFVYEVYDKKNGKRYIGKKIFFNKVSKPPLKGKKNRRISRVASNWKVYYGSNPTILKLGEEACALRFSRQILRLCSSKAEMSYHEAKLLFDVGAILSVDYYNEVIDCRINARQMKGYGNAENRD